MTGRDEDDTGGFASPPCYLHEFEEAGDAPGPFDPQQRKDLQRWRKAERKRLIDARLAIPAEQRQRHDARIRERLESEIGAVEGRAIAAYWPIRGEPDLLPLLEKLDAGGARCALPVVSGFAEPLVFRAWSPGDPLVSGFRNIPEPADESPQVVPDLVISAVVGFDSECYRLGYGGGFYDRTLAGFSQPVDVIGVGYALAALPTIFPQSHDIPMSMVLTENGTHLR